MVNGLPRVGWVVNGLLWVGGEKSTLGGGEWSTWGRMGGECSTYRKEAWGQVVV